MGAVYCVLYIGFKFHEHQRYPKFGVWCPTPGDPNAVLRPRSDVIAPFRNMVLPVASVKLITYALRPLVLQGQSSADSTLDFRNLMGSSEKNFANTV